MPASVKAITIAIAALFAIMKFGPVTIAIMAILALLDDFYTYLDGGEAALGPVWELLIKHGKSIINVLTVLISMFAAYTATVKVQTSVTKAATIAQALLNLAMKANPIAIVISLIAGLIAIGVLLYQNWDTVKEKLGQLWAKFKETFPGAGRLIEGVVDKVKSLVQWMGKAKDAVGEGLSKAKSFFGFGGGTEPTKGYGGIISSPQKVVAGEDGPEMIIPINKPKRAQELMSQLSGMLGTAAQNYQAANQPIGPAGTAGGDQNVNVNQNNTINVYGGADPNATGRAVNDTSNAMLIRSLQGVLA
jgi:hypothetical protein